MSTDDTVVLRLASGRDGDGQPFLLPHHLLAAGRLERLIERSHLAPRVTMSYDTARVGGGDRSGNSAAEATDTAAQARQKLNQLARTIPPDCWDVMIDVCAFGKGLQLVETERRWPRRSAKLVLRIALEQLAHHLGLTPQAQGVEQGQTRSWLPERLPIIAGSEP
jgi:hypothetical protein